MIYYAFLENSKFELKTNCLECYLSELISDPEIAADVGEFMTNHSNDITQYFTKKYIYPPIKEFFENLKERGLPVDDIIRGFRTNWKLKRDFYKVCEKKDFYEYLDCILDDGNNDVDDVAEILVAEITIPENLTKHHDGLYHLTQDFTHITRKIDLDYVLELAQQGVLITNNNENGNSAMKILMRYAISYKKRDIIDYLIDECDFDINSKFARFYNNRCLNTKSCNSYASNYIKWAMIYRDIDTAMHLFRKGCTRYVGVIMTSIDLGRFDVVETMISDFDLTILDQKDQEHLMSRVVDTNAEILQKYLNAGLPLNDDVLDKNTIESISVAYYLVQNDLGLNVQAVCAAIADLAYKENGALWQYMENHNYFQGDVLINDLRDYALKKDDRYLADYLFSKGINVNDEDAMAYVISFMYKHHLMFFQVLIENGVDLNCAKLRKKALATMEYCKTYRYTEEKLLDRDLWLKTFNYLVENAGILQLDTCLFKIASFENWALISVLETYPDLDVNQRIAYEKLCISYSCNGLAFPHESKREISLIEIVALRNFMHLDTKQLEDVLDILLRRGCCITNEELTRILNYHFNQLTFTSEKLYRLFMRVIKYFSKQRAFHFEHWNLEFWKTHFDF